MLRTVVLFRKPRKGETDLTPSGASCTLETVDVLRPSEAAKSRVAELVAREKREGLTPEETSELERYLQTEHLMRLVKARAAAP
jgi:hypothetical protein